MFILRLMYELWHLAHNNFCWTKFPKIFFHLHDIFFNYSIIQLSKWYTYAFYALQISIVSNFAEEMFILNNIKLEFVPMLWTCMFY